MILLRIGCYNATEGPPRMFALKIATWMLALNIAPNQYKSIPTLFSFMLLNKLFTLAVLGSCSAQSKCYSRENLLLHNDTDLNGKAYGIVDVPVNFTMRFSIHPYGIHV
jgi:hypothetical protein